MYDNNYNPGKPAFGGAIGQAAMGTMPQGQPQMQAFAPPQNTGIVPPQAYAGHHPGQGQGGFGQNFGQGQWMQNHPNFAQRFGGGQGFGFGQGFGGMGGGFQPGQGFGGGGSIAQNFGMNGAPDFPGMGGVR